MTTYSPESQMNYVIQWFKTWSEFQKEDFVKILAKGLKKEALDDLVNGVRALSTGELSEGGRPPTLFHCQVKLFNEWWTGWSEDDKDKMTGLFKEADAPFFDMVQAEVDGKIDKLNEDFMTVSPSHANHNGNSSAETNGALNGVSSSEAKPPPPVFNVTKIVVNGPSSFNSVEADADPLYGHVNVTTADDNDKADVNVINITVEEDSSKEPIATEV